MAVTYNSIIAPIKMERRGPVARRAKGFGPGPGWQTVNPPVVKHGFLANYGLHIALAIAGLAVSIGIIGAVLLTGSMQYGFVLVVAAGLAAVMSAALPFFWYSRFRIISGASIA